MSLHTILGSKSWILAVDRGYKSLPLSDTMYYRYSFTFQAERAKELSEPSSQNLRFRGFLTVEPSTINGKAVLVKNGLVQKKVHNPFQLIYTTPEQDHAILKCTKLHAMQALPSEKNKDSKNQTQKLRYEYQLHTPILLNCDRKLSKRNKEETWLLSGSFYDVRALFTPNRSWEDNFGWLSFFASKVLIHLNRHDMKFHILTSGLRELATCTTIDESKLRIFQEKDPDDIEPEGDAESDFDLESQVFLSPSSKASSPDPTPTPKLEVE